LSDFIEWIRVEPEQKEVQVWIVYRETYIEAHDEKIYVDSTYGVGSEFSFTLEKTNQVKKIT
jgi:hypothetical protein